MRLRLWLTALLMRPSTHNSHSRRVPRPAQRTRRAIVERLESRELLAAFAIAGQWSGDSSVSAAHTAVLEDHGHLDDDGNWQPNLVEVEPPCQYASGLTPSFDLSTGTNLSVGRQWASLDAVICDESLLKPLASTSVSFIDSGDSLAVTSIASIYNADVPIYDSNPPGWSSEAHSKTEGEFTMTIAADVVLTLFGSASSRRSIQGGVPKFLDSAPTNSWSYTFRGITVTIDGSAAQPYFAEFPAKAGETLTFKIDQKIDSSSPPANGIEVDYDNNTVTYICPSQINSVCAAEGEAVVSFSLSAADITAATSLEWDAEQGGINLAYRNFKEIPSDKHPTFNLYWANGATKLSEPLLGAGNDMTRGAGQHSKFVNGANLAAPPPGTTDLLLVVDDNNQLTEANESNNSRTLAYVAKIDAVTAKYDGTGADDDVIGRFFAVTGKVDDQQFTVTVSEALAALQSEVVIVVGSDKNSGQWRQDGSARVYEHIGTIDPGVYPGETNITVEAKVQGSVQGSPWTGTLDVEPLPAWMKALKLSAKFDKVAKDYIFTGQLLDLNVPALLALPSNAPFVGGKDLSSTLSTLATVSVLSELNPNVPPIVSGVAEVKVQVLGQKVVDLSYIYPGQGDFRVDLNLTPRQLELQGATATYAPPAIPLPTVPLLAGQPLVVGAFLSATTTLSLDAGLVASLQINFDANGRIAPGSRGEVRLGGLVSGELVELSFGSSAARELTRLLRHVNNVSLPGLVVTAISQFIPPIFQLKVVGAFSVGASIELTTMTPKYLDGAFSLDVFGTVFGVIDLPSWFTDPLDVATSWPKQS